MSFNYNEKYFKKHFGNPIYSRYIKIRNNAIKKEVLKFAKKGKLLDVGFGDDQLIKIFEKQFEVFGTDISEFAVKEIQKKYKKENFKACDVVKEKIPFSEKFDVVCAINTIEHLENPKNAIKNIYDALKPNGILLIYLPTKSNLISKIGYKFGYDVKEHVFRPSISKLKKLLKSTGFKMEKEYCATFFPAKIKSKTIINSFNLYCCVARKT